MHISRVQVRNFRNFKDLEINPFPRSAVIVGENGVGKSNLLHALRLVLDPDLPNSARLLRAEDVCDFVGRPLEDGVEIRVEVEITGFAGDRAAEAVLEDFFVSLEPLIARVTYVFRPRVSVDGPAPELTIDDYEWKIFGGPEDRQADAGNVQRHVPLNVLPALRDAVRDLSRWRDSPLHELLQARPPDPAALKNAAASIQQAMAELALDTQVTEIAEDLAERLENLADPQMDVTPTLGFTSSDPDRLLRSTQLFIDANQVRSVADTSTGYANVIYLGLLLERLATRRKKEAILDSVLAVEEPEAHLHPVLQRQLFCSLLRAETALAVTTHSPHIAAVSPLSSLILLRATAGEGTIAATTADVGLTSGERADIERYLDVSRAEMLFCSAAILVEGPSEAYLLPAFARVLGFDLDAYGVIVANVAGTDFAPYRTLLGAGALGVPHVIITDGDPISQVNGTEKRVYAGLRRASNLIWDGDAAEVPLDTLVGDLVDQGASGDPTIARLAAANEDVFVGMQTLEVDIAPLLSAQMIETYGELRQSSKAVARFRSAVETIANGGEDPADRDQLLRRIEYIGKGRFAQRLAAHIDVIDSSTLRAAITSRDNEILVGPPSSISAARFMEVGSYGYLFAALDRVSRMVRGHGLRRRTVRARGEEQ